MVWCGVVWGTGDLLTASLKEFLIVLLQHKDEAIAFCRVCFKNILR
jgi:hypothetical protein